MENGKIVIAREFTKELYVLVVRVVDKDLRIGTNVYASDFYLKVLKYRKSVNASIRLSSDTKLTNASLNIWKRLLSSGHPINAYDKNSDNVGQSHVMLRTVADLEKFISTDADMQRYRFVLSENLLEGLEVMTHFATRRMRELCGLL